MDHFWMRVATQLAARVTGPLKFRLVLQPSMAVFFAIRSGLADAKAGRPPYFWSLLADSAEREAMIKEGWKHISRLFLLALVLDIVYQLIELHFVYIGEALIVAFVLAIVPYVLLRGPVMRLARRYYTRRRAAQTPVPSS